MSHKTAFAVLALFFSVGLFLPHAAHAATGDITAVRIEPDGWVAEVDISGFTTGGAYSFGQDAHNNPTSPKLVLHVTSRGFDAAGNPTTIQRTVYATQWVRKTYPADTTGSGVGNTKDESVSGGTVTLKVSLSDFVYAGDSSVTADFASGLYTDSGAGGTGLPNTAVSGLPVQTSQITLPYPKVIGRWAWPGYERMTGDFPVEAAIVDRFPINGAPVAVVKFTATDQHGHSVTVSSTAVTKSERAGDANPVQVYAATIPVAGLTPKDVITVNFKAYPWVGDASATLDSSVGADGVAQPSEELGPLMEVNDSDGSYGVGYALVAPGAPTSGQVYSSQAAAEAGGTANAFSTIGKAAEAIKAYQAANFTRNTAGGGVILLAAGSYAFPGYVPPADLGVMDTWLIVRPASGVSRDQAVISSANNSTFPAQRLKFDGITVNAPNNGIAHGRTGSTDAFWIHNSSINATVGAAFYVYKALYATQNQITALNQGFTNYSTYRAPYALIRGNSATPYVDGDFYAILGNKNIRPKFEEVGNPGTAAISDNAIYAFNSIYKVNTVFANIMLQTPIQKGVAIVTNLIEGTTASQPLLQVAGDSSVSTTTNVIIAHNTTAGQRENIAYNEYGSIPYPRLNWSQKFNIYESWNNKDDRFAGGPPDSHRVGGWPVGYNVGSVGNLMKGSTFPPEYNGVSSTIGDAPRYVLDASAVGTGAGNGNYHLTGTSQAIDMAPTSGQFDVLFPYDLDGNPMSGTPDAGAYEYQGVVTDLTPPVLSNLQPTGTFPSGTATTTLSVTTNEAATCAYATSPAVLFASMTQFATTGDVNHTNPLTGLIDGQAYLYYVKCKDTAGNISADSSVSFSVAAAVDTTAPTVSITVPSNGATVATTTIITATASDNVGVANVQLFLDGASLGSPLTTAPYTYSWNTTGAANGSHTLAAVAKDAAGNAATSSAVSVTVNNSVASSTEDISSGLIANLTFDASSISGTTASDASGSGHSGTLVGSPSSVAGVMSEALSFTGSNYVDLGTGSFGLGTTYTTSFWVMQTANGAYYANVTGRGQYVYPLDYQIAGGNSINNLRLGTRTSGGVTYLTKSSVIAKNQWYHVVVTYDNGARKLYVNGALAASDTLTGTLSWDAGNNWVIGKLTPTTGTADGITGAIDDVRIYNRALTAAQVNALYTYRGGSSVVLADTVPPVLSNLQPTGTLPSSAVSTTLSLTTDEAASCAYAPSAGAAFASMTPFTTTGATSHATSVSGLTSGGSYTYYVKCKDGAGNISADSSISFSVAVAADTTAPTVSITSPSGTVSGTVAVAATASDNVGVTSVQYYLDGSALGSALTISPYSYSWNTLTASEGTHTLVAIAKDAAGNTGTSASVVMTVHNLDTTPPTVSISAPAAGATISGTTVVSASASDTSGIASVQLLLDGASLGSPLTTAPYTYSWNTTAVANGSHTLTAVARDTAGNSATSTAISVTVNNASSGADITSGLVTRLTFDTADTTGITANDVSGNGHAGTLVGAPALVTGKYDTALSFTGSNYVDLGTSSFGLGNAYTVSFWVKQTANGAYYANVTGRGQYVYPLDYQIAGGNTINSIRLATRTSNGVTYLTQSGAIAKNQWYHVVVTYDNGARKLYVNGVLTASDTVSGTHTWNAGNNWVIGKLTPTTGTADGITGAIDDVRIYNRALSAADVTLLNQQ